MTKTVKFTAVLAAAAFATFLMVDSGQAAPKPAATIPETVVGRAPWPAQRTLILLPLQLGPGWNLNRPNPNPNASASDQKEWEKAQQATRTAILQIAEQKLQQALQRTGKFSTSQVHRYNPLFLRRIRDRPLTADEGVTPGQEKLLTKEDFDALVANPTLEGVRSALATLNFDQEPLIAQFSMEEITTELGSPSPVVMAHVKGLLYEVNDPVAIKTVDVTSDPVPLYLARKVGKKTLMVRRSASDRIVTAADNSFNQIAREFVKPIDDILLPEPVMPEIPAGAVLPDGMMGTGGASGPTRVPPTVIQVPPGQVLGSFTVPAPRR